MATIHKLFVAVLVNEDLRNKNPGENTGIEFIGYANCKEEGLALIESTATRDTYGRSWNAKVDGDPFYEPDDDDSDCEYSDECEHEPEEEKKKKKKELPESRFMVWDSNIVADDPMLQKPTSIVASISVFSSAAEDPDRSLIRSYKLGAVEPCPNSFIKAETEGDREMVRQMIDESQKEGGGIHQN